MADTPFKIPQHSFRIASLSVFTLSLLFSCCSKGVEHYKYSSFYFATMGLPGLLMAGQYGIHLCWLANPFMIVSWSSLKNNVIALTMSSCALVLAVLFALEMGSQSLSIGKMDHLEIGYWMWLLSMVLMIIECLVVILNKKALEEAQKPVVKRVIKKRPATARR